MRQHRRTDSRRAGGLPRCWSRGDGPTGPLPPRGASVDSSPRAGRGPACDWSSFYCLVWPRARGGGRRPIDGRSMGRVCGLLTGRDPYRQIPIRSCVPGTGEEASGTKARVEIWPYGSLVAYPSRDREPRPKPRTGHHNPVGSTPSSMSENASSLSARYVSQDCRSQTSTRLLAPITTNSRPSPA